MNRNIAEFAIPAMVPVIVVVAVILLATNTYGRYLRISRWKAVLLLLAALLVAIGVGLWQVNQIDMGRTSVRIEFQDQAFFEGLTVVFAGMLPFVLFPFLARLYLAWVAGAVAEEEKAPGMSGVRAWLRGGNLICAILIALCFWIGFGYAFLSPLVLALLALLAYPLLNMAMNESLPPTAAPPPAAGVAGPVTPERVRVLKLLDDGKITAAECAELLNAMGQPTRPAQSPAPRPATASHRKTVLIGVALLLFGFFLPWFAYNLGDVSRELMSQISSPFGGGTPTISQGMVSGLTVHVTGGDIPHGLGWFVLLFGVVAAVFPYLAANLDSETTQKVSLIALGLGTIILLYLFTRSIRFTSVGLLLVLAGYALEILGVIKERQLDWLRAR
jgi:hypothetical protein